MPTSLANLGRAGRVISGTSATALAATSAAVSTARQRGDLRQLGGAEGELRVGLDRLFALAESYPELKAHQAFQLTTGDQGFGGT
jgi:hypothetical protein